MHWYIKINRFQWLVSCVGTEAFYESLALFPYICYKVKSLKSFLSKTTCLIFIKFTELIQQDIESLYTNFQDNVMLYNAVHLLVCICSRFKLSNILKCLGVLVRVSLGKHMHWAYIVPLLVFGFPVLCMIGRIKEACT